MNELWREYQAIQKGRREKMSEAMKDYDAAIYYPALKDLRLRCSLAGHQRGKFHDNGLGYSWYWCSQCGDRMDVVNHHATDS